MASGLASVSFSFFFRGDINIIFHLLDSTMAEACRRRECRRVSETALPFRRERAS